MKQSYCTQDGPKINPKLNQMGRVAFFRNIHKNGANPRQLCIFRTFLYI